jgi:hypothetical protein
MASEEAIIALAALAQPTRLDVFRLLVKGEPDEYPFIAPCYFGARRITAQLP